MAKSRQRWWASKGRPHFDPGDLVTPNGKFNYTGNHAWASGEYRRVLFVSYNESGGYWELGVFNPNMNTVSRYNPANFTKDSEMAYERTKYFAVKLNHPEDGLSYLFSGDETQARDTRHEVQVDVGKIIKHGDRWLVCQTIMMIEGEEPRPPMRITEYK